MKIGIIGGRFDPPHIGHLKAAEAALRKFNLDEVWFMPVNKGNLRKEAEASASDRLAMLKLMTKGKINISDLDIIRGGITYTIDTILDLKAKYPGYKFYFLIGGELEKELPKWKDYKFLKKETEFLVMDILEDKGEKISSSKIKARIKERLSIKGLVTDSVEEYMRKHRLYK